MAGALHESLAIVEVALRNAMDRELKVWSLGRANSTEEWLRYPALPLSKILDPKGRSGTVHRTYDEARRRAQQSLRVRAAGHRRHQAPITHDDIIASVTFGTWVKLLPSRQTDGTIGPSPQRGMWNHALRNAFPNHPHATAVHYWVSQVHALRNRVAHAEPLLYCDFAGYHRTATRLLRAIDVEIGQWHSGISRVPRVAAERP